LDGPPGRPERVRVTECRTTRSGVAIRFLDSGPEQPARGLPILFSPGFSDFADEYAELFEAFAPRRLLVVEVRGRGGSEAPPTGYTAAQHASDLRAVLDETGIQRFHLMTFSRGTTWGLDLALGDPTRVASVSIGDYWAGEKGLGEDVADYMMSTRFRGRPMPERVADHVARGLFRASVERDLTDRLAATGLPVLVATGTESGCLLDPGSIQAYRDRVPGIEMVVIPGAGHDLFRPDRLAYPRAVMDFIVRRAPDGVQGIS
jgi:pimeloyl-ACP methyl ester carboxylesterase